MSLAFETGSLIGLELADWASFTQTRQLVAVSSLLPPCGSQGLNSGHQAWWKYPLSHLTGLMVKIEWRPKALDEER